MGVVDDVLAGVRVPVEGVPCSGTVGRLGSFPVSTASEGTGGSGGADVRAPSSDEDGVPFDPVSGRTDGSDSPGSGRRHSQRLGGTSSVVAVSVPASVVSEEDDTDGAAEVCPSVGMPTSPSEEVDVTFGAISVPSDVSEPSGFGRCHSQRLGGALSALAVPVPASVVSTASVVPEEIDGSGEA